MTDAAPRPADQATPSRLVLPHRAGGRVLLVGWDGAEWKLVAQLMATGRMPHLASLCAAGVVGPLRARSLSRPSVWTSVATGKRPHKHGVLGPRVVRSDGRGSKPVGPAARTCKALWTIAGEHGMRSLVVGWPGTHPAEQINGVMISDRHAPALAGITDPPPPGDAVHPRKQAAELTPLRLRARDVDFASLVPFIPRLADLPSTDRGVEACAAILSETATLHAVATYAVTEWTPWNMAAVHYGGIARFARRFTEDKTPVYSEVVAGAYAFHDMMLGRLIELIGPEPSAVLVVSAGGVMGGGGFAVMSGAGVRSGSDVVPSGATVLDVTPTVLALLGIPRGSDMDGRAWVEALEAAPVADDEVFSWEAAGATEARRDDTDAYEQASDASVRHLLELGYIEPPDPEAQRDADRVALANAMTLARVLMDVGQATRAIEALAPWYAREPGAPGLVELLAEAHFRAGRHRSLRALIDAILARDADRAPLAHLGLAMIELAAGRTGAAVAHAQLAEAQTIEGAAAPASLHALIGRVYARLSRWDDAERCYRRSVESEPEAADAIAGLSAACLAQGRADEATDHARRAIVIARDRPEPHYRLARALLALGRSVDAETALHACLAIDPDVLGAHRRLAELYAGPLYDPRRQRRHESRVQEILLRRRADGVDESEL